MPNAVGRASARTALAAFLTTALVPVTVRAVYAYPRKHLAELYPALTIESASTLRERKFIGVTKLATEFVLTIRTYVRWDDPEENPPITEQTAEDALDYLEQMIADAFADSANVHAGGFDLIGYDGPTETGGILREDSVLCRSEVIRVRLKMVMG
ncbi:MAG: hypothetical protein H0U60_02465 [Blastocatellia bacterium]|nr:hypothetical protein [Blastocatellia bacterium]